MAVRAAEQTVTGPRRPARFAGDPILTSKITAPDVPDWVVARPRITKMITEGTRWRHLTVVTGPVGAGKTMALASWAATAPGPVAWVSLDEYNTRPAAFWSYAAAALDRSGVAVSEILPGPGRGRAAENLFLLRLASALAAQSPPVTLILDDLHLINEPRILNGIDFLIRSVGSSLRLVVSSRTDPLLPLHRHRLAGQLAEIRGADLAFSGAEAGLLMAQHGCTPSADSLDCLVRLTEGWAAGLRLAAISMAGHPDPDQFVKTLRAEDSTLTGYLAEAVLDTQPREVRELLLSTSVLEVVNAEAASELTGSGQSARILEALARSNAFVEPIGGGWYRYHALFAQLLRLRLRLECPDRIVSLHRRTARWCERNGRLTDAVRHAAEAGDWQLAASAVVDGMAIGEITEPADSPSLADEFAQMPSGEAWPEPQPYLVCAAAALAVGRPESAATTLDTAEKILDRLPADQGTTARLAAAMIRLAAARRSGDLTVAARAATCAEALMDGVRGDGSARHGGIRAQALFARGVVELWSGRLGEAARVLDSGVTAAAQSGQEHLRIDCLSHLAMVEALRGELGRAVKLADQATKAGTDGQPGRQGQRPRPAALAALAWVHLEHHELRQARGRLKQLDTALRTSRDRLIGAVACLIAACDGLAEGHAEVAAQFAARARSGWSVPPWLEQRLNLAESGALAATGDIEAALAVARRAADAGSPEASVTLAQAWTAAGDSENARRVLEPVLAAHDEMPQRIRVQAYLADARLSYAGGDSAHGRRSLGRALRLAERERLRLPFALERGWIGPALRRDTGLARAYRHLLPPALCGGQLPAPPGGATRGMTTPSAVEPLTEREREVLLHVSDMLTTAEIAGELHISTNTVKSHIKNICHKLAAAHRGEAVRTARQLQLI